MIVHTMNHQVAIKTPEPTPDQALRLRSIITEIVQCCQERALFEARMFDLPRAELRCLLLFKSGRYLAAKDIAEALEVGKSRVTKLVNGLLEKGLIERIDDPRDGRVKLLCPTPEGKSRMGRIDEFITSVHARVLTNLEPSQRTTVFAALEQLWASMESVRQELGMD